MIISYRKHHGALRHTENPHYVWELLDLPGLYVRSSGLVACQPRPFRLTTVPGDGAGAPDLLNRDFTASVPGSKPVGDSTYTYTFGVAITMSGASRIRR